MKMKTMIRPGLIHPDLWNLAVVTTGPTSTRRKAYSKFTEIIKSQADLMLFLHYRDGLHVGWSRGLRVAINRWLRYAVSNGITLTFGEWLYGWTLIKIVQKSHPKRDLLEVLDYLKGEQDHGKDSCGE